MHIQRKMARCVSSETVFVIALMHLIAIQGVSSLSFRSEPRDVIVEAGSSVVLPCYADGSDSLPLTFTWYRNGQNKLPSGYSQNKNGSLKVAIPQDPVNYEDYEGLYHCVVSNQHNQLRSRDASLRVSRCTTIGTFPGSRTNLRGVFFANDTIAVTQEGYFHPLQAAWDISCSKGSDTVPVPCPSTQCNLSYSLYPIERQKSLSVLVLSLNQLRKLTGDMLCISFLLHSVCQKDTTKFLQASFSALSYAPRLSLGPVDTTAMVGGDVTLPCVANAASSYTWTKDSHPVNTTTTPRMNLRNGSLQIKGVSNTDAGGYVCKANIHLSKILQSSPATLSVYVLPFVTMSLSKETSSRGDVTVTVKCTVLGSRPLTVKLLLDGVVKETIIVNNTDTESHLVFQNIPLSVGRIVQCVASNTNGSSQTSRFINITTTDSPATSSPYLTTSLPASETTTRSMGGTGTTTPPHGQTSSPPQSPPISYFTSLYTQSKSSAPSLLYLPSPSSSFAYTPSPSRILSQRHNSSPSLRPSRDSSPSLISSHNSSPPLRPSRSPFSRTSLPRVSSSVDVSPPTPTSSPSGIWFPSHTVLPSHTWSQTHARSTVHSFRLSPSSFLLSSNRTLPLPIQSTSRTLSLTSTSSVTHAPSVSHVDVFTVTYTPPLSPVDVLPSWYVSSPVKTPSPSHTLSSSPSPSDEDTPNSTATTTTGTHDPPLDTGSSGGLAGGTVAGIVVLAVFSLCMTVLFVLAIIYRRKRRGSYSPRKKRFSSQLEAWIDHPYEDMEIPQPVSTVRLTYVVRSPVYDSVAHEDEDRYQTPAVENPGGSRCNQPTETVQDDTDIYDDVIEMSLQNADNNEDVDIYDDIKTPQSASPVSDIDDSETKGSYNSSTYNKMADFFEDAEIVSEL